MNAPWVSVFIKDNRDLFWFHHNWALGVARKHCTCSGMGESEQLLPGWRGIWWGWSSRMSLLGAEVPTPVCLESPGGCSWTLRSSPQPWSRWAGVHKAGKAGEVSCQHCRLQIWGKEVCSSEMSCCNFSFCIA